MRRLLVGLFSGLLLGAAPSTAHAQPPNLDDYVWASTCRTCHAAESTAWDKTKHARALARLSGPEREPGACVGCHVTGAKQLAPKEENANVQCEVCHGAGKAHVEAAKAGQSKPGAITRKPAESVCVGCHSEKSPHFKFFSYAALAPIVHPIVK